MGPWKAVRNRTFRNTRHSPTTNCRAGVHNPCPQSASHNHRSPRVVRRSVRGVIYSATPVSTPPTTSGDLVRVASCDRVPSADHSRDGPRSQQADDAGRVPTATTLAGRSLVPARRHDHGVLRCRGRDRRPRRRPVRRCRQHDGLGRLQPGLARRGLGRVGRGQELGVGVGHRRSAPMHHRLLR
jgi:hypothetical protein